MLRILLALSFFAPISFCFADNNELVHNFFKNRRALQEGLTERIEPGSNKDLKDDAKKVAQLLTPCAVKTTKNNVTESNLVNGNDCQVQAQRQKTTTFTEKKATINTRLAVQNVRADVLTQTGISSAQTTENADYFLRKKSDNNYEVTSMVERKTDVIATNTSLATVTVVEDITYDAAKQDTLFIVSFSSPVIQRTVGEYHSVKGVDTCKLNNQVVSCALLNYLYGY